jgi:hypothetical protein
MSGSAQAAGMDIFAFWRQGTGMTLETLCFCLHARCVRRITDPA